MSILSELLSNGVYPKRMKISKIQAVEICREFKTSWTPDMDYEFTDNIYVIGKFKAYYSTKTGLGKYCTVYFGE